MTDNDIANQIQLAAHRSLERFRKTVTEGATLDPKANIQIVEGAVIVEFLSATLQSAWFLCKADGEVTPQQLQRAVMMIAKDLGLESGFERLPDGTHEP